MNITINALELASELAHEMVRAKLNDDNTNIYEEPFASVTNYTDKAQDIFNEWYDHYLHKIEECNIN